MRRRSVLISASATLAAAILGNAFVGKEALDWFRELKRPRMQMPMPGFLAVAAAYYSIMGYVLARGIDRRNGPATAWAVAVLIGNEGWNGLLFGKRSTRAALLGVVAFLIPLSQLQWSVRRDRRARWALLVYSIFVAVYDLPWAYRLWRLNPPQHH
jgi:tryptophan-rich sensory protein